eukprot:TRINITY_DN291_c0_g1_i1.p1 TRINITY_DN291_c0_g1~~TRINITY_DN291_c0_g1_i1.p1  ORF type:complete len:132 (-),score=21.67 TRINITY_DN291_c0_g1_i1:61-456(-)
MEGKSLPFNQQVYTKSATESTGPLSLGNSVHPVEHIQKNWFKNQMEMEQFAIKKIFGTQMTARLEMERQILSQFQRLPSLESSFVGLEAVLGTDEDMEFEDYLSDPRMSEKSQPSVHDAMEAKLGMSFVRL